MKDASLFRTRAQDLEDLNLLWFQGHVTNCPLLQRSAGPDPPPLSSGGPITVTNQRGRIHAK